MILSARRPDGTAGADEVNNTGICMFIILEALN
jgi:hypothetical protein